MWDQQTVDLHVGVLASSLLVDTYVEDSRSTQALLEFP